MAFRPGERVRPQLALNAIRVLTPPGTIPASVIPFDRALLHAYIDRPEIDVFATRHDETDMAGGAPLALILRAAAQTSFSVTTPAIPDRCGHPDGQR